MTDIVIVCGNRHKAAFLAEFVRVLGQSAEVLFTGWQAMEAFDLQLPQVVIWDCETIELSARDAARRIRHSPHAGSALLIASLNWADTEDPDVLLESGFDYLLPMRLSAYALRELLEKGLRRLAEAPCSASQTWLAPAELQ